MPIHNKRQVNQVKFRVPPEERLNTAVSSSTFDKSSGHHQDNLKGIAISKEKNKDRLSRKTEKQSEHGLISCLITSSPDLRMGGGENDPAQRHVGKLPRTDSECQFQAPGYHFLTKREPSVKTQEVKMSPSIVMKKELKHKCNFFAELEDTQPFKNKITQTLYRESSAQTMSFLPEVRYADKNKTLELFSLPSVLPGSSPPGLHEVEVLERARKRWAFSDALKIHFKRLLNEAKKVALNTEYKEILNAFEWEQWIQREEDIQECQMMRLEIVIKMFDKREKEMHAASKSRIEKACERIEKRREAGLRKNEIEFKRGMRRLDFQVAKTSRKWEKQSPMHSLGSPCSEFYAPLLRYGVDPARRNYVSKIGQKAFDMRIDELEKKVNISSLKCPFRKLKDWSKPKKYEKEYERNFCNDDNLQKLFESLKALRTQAAKEKEEPKCLRKRWKPTITKTPSQMSLGHLTYVFQVQSKSIIEGPGNAEANDKWSAFVEEEKIRNSATVIADLKSDRKKENMEHLLNIYEGTYIGWVMQFLSEEMTRLSELRRLHFFSIMAQKERWRREAAEAGLRQRENDMRLMYEEMFQHCNVVNNDVSNKYISTILNSDMYNMAEGEATETVSELAKQIDANIERWLESFKLIENPLTYVPLRLMLNDMVSPNMEDALQCYESFLIAQYVVEDVIFPRVWDELDPFDIASTLTSDLIDRLIDNDLYLLSTDSEREIPQRSSWCEAHAIIRKLIRQAVPGRRWLETNERIVTENYNDLFDDIFARIIQDMENPPCVNPNDLIDLHMTVSQNAIRSSDNIREKEIFDFGNFNSLPGSDFLRKQTLTLMKKFKVDNITRLLENVDDIPVEDRPSGSDEFIKSQMINPISNLQRKPSEVFSIKSTLDISEIFDFSPFKGRGYRVLLPNGEEKNADIGILEFLQKEDDEEEKLELANWLKENKMNKDIEIEEEDVPDIDSPRVSFHQMFTQPSKSLDNQEEFKIEQKELKMDSTKKKFEQIDYTSNELEQMDSFPKKSELMDSTPTELKATVDSTPTELKPTVDSTPKKLISISPDSKDLKSIDSITQELEQFEGAANEPESELEAEFTSELSSEPSSEPMVQTSVSFIPPVRSSGLKTLKPSGSLLKPDQDKIKKLKDKKDKPESQEDEENEEKRHLGSLGSHFNTALDAEIPIQTSDDHLPLNKNTVENASRRVSDSAS
uniref:Cilia- and flagella-associated protein 91 n=1 Tax=Drosophila rhopaloa TaxID=1041015 RepID=A0A6P4FIL3_DRORH